MPVDPLVDTVPPTVAVMGGIVLATRIGVVV